MNAENIPSDQWIKQGDVFLVRNPDEYALRLKKYSDAFFHKIHQRPYPLDYKEQGMSYLFPDTRIQFLTFNSCWQIDQFHRKRSGVNASAVTNALSEALKQTNDAIKTGRLPRGAPILRLAVWHHPVHGRESMDGSFIGRLQQAGVRLCLHGDVHEATREAMRYWDEKTRVHVVGVGSFGASASQRPESIPRLYNLMEVSRDLKRIRFHTRYQRKAGDSFAGWNEWPRSDGREGAQSYFDLDIEPAFSR